LSERELRVRPLARIPEIRKGDRLGELIAAAGAPAAGEIVVISQKIVSKAEGRLRRLADVEVGERAERLAHELGKSPALVELVLAESRTVIRAERDVLITQTRAGWICANAGIDSSNVPGEGWVALLPEDADESARRIRGELRSVSGASPAIVIADSFGRPWRLGQSEVAIGCAGLDPLEDWRGRSDSHGRPLAATRISIADEVASAADLVRGKDSGVPGAIVSGLADHVTAADGPGARAQQRAAEEDLFR
jgi:coenzyme F420-0:L-glutamate ligase / coenzyme F420-1:gamma-L-glutamate ligase